MIKQGLLDKHGKPTDSTPTTWTQEYVDYSNSAKKDVPPKAVKATPVVAEVVKTPKRKRESESEDASPAAPQAVKKEKKKKKKEKAKAAVEKPGAGDSDSTKKKKKKIKVEMVSE